MSVVKSIGYGFGGCLGVGLAIFVSIVVLASLGKSAAERRKAAEAPGEGITLSEFNQIQTGMSIGQVNAIVGTPGEVQVQGDFATGTQFASSHAIYQWKAEKGFGNAHVTIIDGAVSGKAQFGL